MNFLSKESKYNKYIVWISLVFAILMYTPYLTVFFENSLTMNLIRDWRIVYEFLNPLGILPIIVGFLSLLVQGRDKGFLKAIIFGLYTYAFLISFTKISMMNSVKELWIYAPHIIIFILHFSFWRTKGLYRFE